MHIERTEIGEAVLKENDREAAGNRERFRAEKVLAVNLMGAPGAGKTTLLVSLADRMRDVPLAVVEGDIAGDADSRRISEAGVPVYQINTYGACHLLASQVAHAWEHLCEGAETPPKMLFIENVGNLVCPAEFDLGEALRMVVYSVPEGADKPSKYPLMFLRTQAVVLNKADLAAAGGVDVGDLRSNVMLVNPAASVFTVSATTGEGLDELVDWLRQRLEAYGG